MKLVVAIGEAQGRIAAANALGISRVTLYKKMKRYGLEFEGAN